MLCWGRRRKTHLSIDQEELGLLKGNRNNACLHTAVYLTYIYIFTTGFVRELYPDRKVPSEDFNSIVKSACFGSRRRCKQQRAGPTIDTRVGEIGNGCH